MSDHWRGTGSPYIGRVLGADIEINLTREGSFREGTSDGELGS